MAPQRLSHIRHPYVPEGQPKIAQRFIAGILDPQQDHSAVGTAEALLRGEVRRFGFSRPYGTEGTQPRTSSQP